MRCAIMGMSAECNNNADRRRAHLLLMLKIESGRMLAVDGDNLEKIDIDVSTRLPIKNFKNGILQGDRSKSILPQVKLTEKQRSVLEEDKRAP